MLLNQLFEYQDLESEKQNIIAKISGLSAENEDDAALLDRIYKVLNSGNIGNNIQNALVPPSADELMTDAEVNAHRQEITKIISNLDANYGNLSKFLNKLEAGGVVNVAELKKPLTSLSAIFNNDPLALKAFVALVRYGVGIKQKGPGEFGLAMLSNKVRLAAGEGDLEVDGIGKVELKVATGKAGGRIGYGGSSQKSRRATIDKYAEQIPTVISKIGGAGGSLGLVPFMDGLNQDLPPNDANNQKLRKQIALELFAPDLEKFAEPVANAVATQTAAGAVEQEYVKQNFLWYKNRDDFDALLVMTIPVGKSSMMRNENDAVQFRTGGHSQSTSISIIPTQAGAGREQWAQLTHNAAKVK